LWVALGGFALVSRSAFELEEPISNPAAAEVTKLKLGLAGSNQSLLTLAATVLHPAWPMPLAQKVRGQPFGTVVIASGTSCRHQIEHLAPVRARHMAEVLADALA
jgi:hypothetical protein